MSFNVAGDTSECLRSSGDRGGARPDPSDPFPVPALPEFRPIFTSECRRCNVSAIGTSNRLSVEFCVSTGCNIDELCCLRRQMLQHHVFCKENKKTNITGKMTFAKRKRQWRAQYTVWWGRVAISFFNITRLRILTTSFFFFLIWIILYSGLKRVWIIKVKSMRIIRFQLKEMSLQPSSNRNQMLPNISFCR